MPFEAGKFNRRIDFQSDTGTTVNDHNEHVESWGDLETSVPCKIVELQGKETVQADQITAVQRLMFTVRYNSIRNAYTEASHRIVYKSNNYEILSIRRPDRNKTLEFTGEKED